MSNYLIELKWIDGLKNANEMLRKKNGKHRIQIQIVGFIGSTFSSVVHDKVIIELITQWNDTIDQQPISMLQSQIVRNNGCENILELILIGFFKQFHEFGFGCCCCCCAIVNEWSDEKKEAE